MRRRSRTNGEGSISLLLDAMCNAFGGVMFIAIAVIVITMKVPDEQTESEQAEEEILTDLKTSINQAETELNALYEDRNVKESILKRILPGENKELVKEFMQLKKTETQLRAKVSRLQEDKRHNEEQEKRQQEKLSKLSVEIDQDRKRRINLKKRIDTTAKSLTDIESSVNSPIEPSRTLKLNFATLRGEPYRNPFFIIVDGGKIYRIDTYAEDVIVPPESGISDDVRCEYVSEFSKCKFYPNKGKGTPIAKMTTQDLQRYFAPINKSRYFINAYVRDDSFKSWLKLRSFLRKHDFHYNWSPVIKGEPCVFWLTDENIDYQNY